MKTPKWRIAYDKTSGHIHESFYGKTEDAPETETLGWLPNTYTFSAVLLVSAIWHSGSSTKTKVVDMTTGARYNILSEVFLTMVLSRTLVKGMMSGTWAFSKSGTEYFLKSKENC